MSNILPVMRFIARTMRHKWRVFRFGLETGAPLWRLLIHDWHKLTPWELPQYARKFCGSDDDQMGFAQAWNHHHKHSPHHWEYWIMVTGHARSPIGADVPLPMPEWAVREMVADWLAASTGYSGSRPTSLASWTWYHGEIGKVRLHPDSRAVLDIVLDEYFARP